MTIPLELEKKLKELDEALAFAESIRGGITICDKLMQAARAVRDA